MDESVRRSAAFLQTLSASTYQPNSTSILQHPSPCPFHEQKEIADLSVFVGGIADAEIGAAAFAAAVILQPSTFNLQPSTFNFQPTRTAE
jgi:hypothetical protein